MWWCLWHRQRLKIINVTEASNANPDSYFSTWFVSPSCHQTDIWCRQTELLLCLDLDLKGGAFQDFCSYLSGWFGSLWKLQYSVSDASFNVWVLSREIQASLPPPLHWMIWDWHPRLSESKNWQHPASGNTEKKLTKSVFFWHCWARIVLCIPYFMAIEKGNHHFGNSCVPADLPS